MIFMFDIVMVTQYQNGRQQSEEDRYTQRTGYYRTLCGENKDETNSTEEDSLVLTDDDVFEVERLVEKRIRKVNRPALS